VQGRHALVICGSKVDVVLVALDDLADGFVEDIVQWCPAIFVFSTSVRTMGK
jgi:hypothetical protein